jgi:hypothetical protein
MLPGSPAVSDASPPVTAGTDTPPYVTDVASVTPELAFVQTKTVTPRAVPPGAWLHDRADVLVSAVVPVGNSELARCATAMCLSTSHGQRQCGS